MTDLERRALLGDAEAQRECTEKGMALACPFCGGPATAKSQRVQYGLSGTIISCKKCMVQLYSPDQKAVSTPDGVRNMPIENHERIGIGRWNTRPAPPIGRCGECKHSTNPAALTMIYGEPGTLTCHHGPCNRRNVNENDFCSYFEPKGDEENAAD